MRHLFLFITILVLSATYSYSQQQPAGQKDSTGKANPVKNDSLERVKKEKMDSIYNSKMAEYKDILKKADLYEARTEVEIQKTTLYKTEARLLLDSSNSVIKKAGSDKKHAKFYLYEFNYLIDKCALLTGQADSSLLVAQHYKDTANVFNKQAESFYFTIAEQYKPQVDSGRPVTYVIQLGAGDMNNKYFEKVQGVEVITPSDGIKRFIIGKYDTKESALEYRQKMIEQGFTDAFIRTQDSSKY
jgi:hypothetical protein